MGSRRPHAAPHPTHPARKRGRAPHRSVARRSGVPPRRSDGAGSPALSDPRAVSGVRGPVGTLASGNHDWLGVRGLASSSWDGRGGPTSSPTVSPDDARTDGRPRSDWSSGALRDCSPWLVHGLLDAAAPADRECHELTAGPERLGYGGWSRCRGVGRPGGCPDRCPTPHPCRPEGAGSTTCPVAALVRAASSTSRLATASQGSTGGGPSPRTARAKPV